MSLFIYLFVWNETKPAKQSFPDQPAATMRNPKRQNTYYMETDLQQIK